MIAGEEGRNTMEPREYFDTQRIDVLDDISIGHLPSLIEVLDNVLHDVSK